MIIEELRDLLNELKDDLTAVYACLEKLSRLVPVDEEEEAEIMETIGEYKADEHSLKREISKIRAEIEKMD